MRIVILKGNEGRKSALPQILKPPPDMEKCAKAKTALGRIVSN
jgi:hypothetical protein